MESTPAQLLQQGDGIVGMHQGFSATERHASAAVGHDIAFLLHLRHQFIHRPFTSTLLKRSRGTFFSTPPTEGTARTHHDTVGRQL